MDTNGPLETCTMNMYTVQCTLYDEHVHCTLYTVQCTMYSVHVEHKCEMTETTHNK